MRNAAGASLPQVAILQFEEGYRQDRREKQIGLEMLLNGRHRPSVSAWQGLEVAVWLRSMRFGC